MPQLDEDLASVGAILVEDRVLRRVIKAHRHLPGLGLQVPHARSYALPGKALAGLVEHGEVWLERDKLPDEVVLLRGARGPLEAGDARAVSAIWRGVFHARIHAAFDEQLGKGALTAAAIRERINRVGQTEFDEIRGVLRQEDLLLAKDDEPQTYIEFVALYLELKHFAPHWLERTFPTLHDSEDVDATIALDVDALAILAASRPPNAPPEPVFDELPSESRAMYVAKAVVVPTAKPAAAAARTRGNLARAALCAMRAGDAEGARADLEALVARLAKALHTEDTTGWVDALLPVVEVAGTAPVLRFTAGARMLHDLQTACIVAEREEKVVDVPGWIASLGKQPVVRTLPATREVRIAKHLHGAAHKIAEVGLRVDEDREPLAEAIHAMVERAETNVRTVLRPKIEAALDAVALTPKHLPERVAQKKIVDELLDQAVAVGRLTISNLRDALSHNDLKMPDLRPVQLVKGDQLLRADRILSHSLDGVYRRGEVYLRFLQRLSSILFGTVTGRFLTLYLLLPCIGSFMALQGAQHIVGPFCKLALHLEEPEIATLETEAAGAVFLFLMLHLRPFRAAVIYGAKLLWRTIAFVLWTGPRWMLRTTVARLYFASPIHRWIVRPAIPAAIALLILHGRVQYPAAIAVFVLFALAANSRTGRLVEEMLTDWTVRSTRQLGTRILPAVLKYILYLFSELIEQLDRGIYKVDEWLRFKQGQSKITLVIKGALGALWFVVTYFLRLYVNLFVEPVVNPVKHFPTVTVAAKLTLPFSPQMIHAIRQPLIGPLGRSLAGGFAGFTVFVIPGLAGFLVWELKENWKLYERTRPRELHPVAIGHHGESMVGFLKPGFHSGTIPKLFTKLRRAAWKNDAHGIGKHKEGLHHVEEAIWKFADRELVSLLDEAQQFKHSDVAVTAVELASNRVQIELACPSVGEGVCTIQFEMQSGWLLAQVRRRGWVNQLEADPRAIFEIALAGFYKLAGVDVVREQIAATLDGSPYDIADDGIVVWPGKAYETEAVYDLRSDRLQPVVRGVAMGAKPPVIAGRHAIYGKEPLRWQTWESTWQTLAEGNTPPKIIAGPPLLSTS